MAASTALTYSRRVKVTLNKEIQLADVLGGGRYKAGSTISVPLFLGLKLAQLDLARIEEDELKIQDVTSIKFVEQREHALAKLPDNFYTKLKVTLKKLEKEGDIRTMKALIQEVRELLIYRIRKIAALLATSPNIINDEEFMDKLTAEEKILVASLYVDIVGFVQSSLS